MYKKYYLEFLKQNEGIQHFACHSHYYWPDVTKQAMIDYWNDSAKYVDSKWEYFFGTKVPIAQRYIAESIGSSKPDQIVFAGNTHEFIMRILSCFDWRKEVKILTTDSEFYSFNRQIDRLSELDNFKINKISFDPFISFEERFCEAIEKEHYDLIFFSHVFFNSGIKVRNIEKIVDSVNDSDTIIVIDGYHAFRAIPIDISKLEKRIFYTAGSYKYAQGGEGCCFLHVPENTKLRPVNTGWFADFKTLGKEKNHKVGYSDDGMRFAGSTIDFSSLYRLIAVYELFEKDKITRHLIHEYIQKMQQAFLKELSNYSHPLLNENNLLVDNINDHGHFLTFRLENALQVEKMASLLKEYKIITDYRADRLRFGFALYHDGNYNLSVLNTRRAYFFDELIY